MQIVKFSLSSPRLYINQKKSRLINGVDGQQRVRAEDSQPPRNVQTSCFTKWEIVALLKMLLPFHSLYRTIAKWAGPRASHNELFSRSFLLKHMMR